MSNTYYLLETFHIGQFAWASYGLYNSVIAIRNLQQYEEKSEKAAKWSNEAARQLRLTRTTQTTGALAVVTSMGMALALAVSGQSFPHWFRMLSSPAMLITTLLARGHINNFWTAKAKVPMVDGYNEAIDKTGALMEILRYLEYSWVATSLVIAVFTG